jgi:hypothetical protein
VPVSDRAVRVITVSSVLVVAGVAAIVSYAHMFELAQRSGESWRAYFIPLSVDGMLVLSSLAIVDKRRHRERAGWVPWFGLALGIVASLAANVAAARPELIAQIVAGWPPVALAVSIETLVVVLRGTSGRRPAPREQRPPVVPARPASAAPAEAPRPPRRPSGDDDELARAHELVAAARAKGKRYGRVALAQDLGVTSYRARDLMRQVDGDSGAGEAQSQMRLVM